MELGAILFSLALALVGGAYVVQPILGARGQAQEEIDRRRSELQAERDRALDRLQELDMDHSMGKIPDADYAAERQIVLRQGAEVLRQLDQLGPSDDLEGQLEAAIAEARQSTSAECPSCGTPIVAGDRFCAQCGTDLEEPEA